MVNITPIKPLCHGLQDPQPSPLLAALSYASRSWPVLPLHHPTSPTTCSCQRAECSSIGKHPRTKHGVKDASTSDEQIRRWWGTWPEANVGIATGRISGILIIDVDGRHNGFESLEQIKQAFGPLPGTLEVETGAGLHLYFSHPDCKIKNRVGVYPGIDLRSDQGYIVAPPSLHKSGKFYGWRNSLGISPVPHWFQELLDTNRDVLVQKNPSQACFADETRNVSFASVAGALRAKGFSREQLEATLLELNLKLCNPPLEEEEVRDISGTLGETHSTTG